jgi:quercetin dioxygenase-like cupin family protein
MKKFSGFLVALAFVSLSVPAEAQPAATPPPATTPAPSSAMTGAAAGEPQLSTVQELKWLAVPEIKGAAATTLWEDTTRGIAGRMVQLKAGTDVPLHWHTADERAVILTGTLVIRIEGQEAKDLTAGSFIAMPGGKRHTVTCKPGTDCVFTVVYLGTPDIQFPEGAGPTPARPAATPRRN